MTILIFICFEILIAILTLVSGVICISQPQQAIKIQQKFYERINWKMEPINLKKELNNTRIMGAICVILAIGLIVNILI